MNNNCKYANIVSCFYQSYQSLILETVENLAIDVCGAGCGTGPPSAAVGGAWGAGPDTAGSTTTGYSEGLGARLSFRLAVVRSAPPRVLQRIYHVVYDHLESLGCLTCSVAPRRRRRAACSLITCLRILPRHQRG